MAFIKSKQVSAGSFVKGKQNTGNAQATIWDSGNTTWDTAVAPANHETIWDKDKFTTWIKGKQVA